MSQVSGEEVHINAALQKLEKNKNIKLKIVSGGKLKMEKSLPFLFVYRTSPENDNQLVKLLLSEISYIIIPSATYGQQSLSELILAIAKKLSNEFGSFLLLEIWEGRPGSKTFKINTAKDKAPATIDTLKSGLAELINLFPQIEVEVNHTRHRHPENLGPLLLQGQYKGAGCLLLGLEIPPVYKSAASGAFFPVFFRTLRSSLSTILRKAVFEFMRVQTASSITTYHKLGSKSISQSVWHVDRKLAEIEDTFQFLLLISPLNTNEARRAFVKDKFQKSPQFQYRLLPVDPDHLKEKLYRINIHKIEDPSLAFLYRDKREELEKQITMLGERGTADFMYSSMRLYKPIDQPLLQVAREILSDIPAGREQEWATADCHEFARRAREEIAFYRQQYPQLNAQVTIKPDVVGLLVSKGQLIIGETFTTPKNRLQALIDHEVGTHVLTWYNGSAQPLKLLSNGFADYDELQEGLAVLAEYLAGGLSSDRLRLLAARVIAAHLLTEGANFVDTFRDLHHQYEFDIESAFDVTARIFQGGGYTKDIIYLRGLMKLLDYLKSGGELEPLFIGKIAAKHIPVMTELHHRNILRPMPLRPRYLRNKDAQMRLNKIKTGISLTALIE